MKTLFRKIIYFLLLAVLATVTQTSAYYEYGDTVISECPIPDSVLEDPDKTLEDILSWDRYNPDGDYLSHTCYAEDETNCPYGIARWEGQCTYAENTIDQWVDWDCVDRVRAYKALLYFERGICELPAGEEQREIVLEEIGTEEDLLANNIYFMIDPEKTCGEGEEQMKNDDLLLVEKSSLLVQNLDFYMNGSSAGDSYCGNTEIDGFEDCDDGSLNGTENSNCNAFCKFYVCGNGVVEGLEECDDGNFVDDDLCSLDCKVQAPPPKCGNRKVEAGEECDDGDTVNKTEGDYCYAPLVPSILDTSLYGEKTCVYVGFGATQEAEELREINNSVPTQVYKNPAPKPVAIDEVVRNKGIATQENSSEGNIDEIQTNLEEIDREVPYSYDNGFAASAGYNNETMSPILDVIERNVRIAEYIEEHPTPEALCIKYQEEGDWLSYYYSKACNPEDVSNPYDMKYDIDVNGYVASNAQQEEIIEEYPLYPDLSSLEDEPTIKNTLDPVILSNGEFVYENVLLSLPSAGVNYSFGLSYRNKVLYNGFVGYNFDHNRNIFVRRVGDDIYYFDGRLHSFKFVSQGDVWKNELLAANIIQREDEYILTFANGVKQIFSEQGESINNYRIIKHQVLPGLSMYFNYDSDGKLISVKDTNNRLIAYSYNEDERLKQVTDPYGRTVYLSYYEQGDLGGSAGDLKEAKIFYGAESRTIEFTYTKVYITQEGLDDELTEHILSHNIQSLVDSKNQDYVFNIYDAADRIVYQKYGEDAGSFGYWTNSKNDIKKTVSVNRKGQSTTYVRDEKGNLDAMYVHDKSVGLDYSYNNKGQLIEEKLPNGVRVIYTYDPEGNMVRKVRDAGEEKEEYEYTYDTKGRLKSLVDYKGIETTYEYNAKGLIASKKLVPQDGFKSPRVTKFNYNDHYLLSSMTLPDGQKVNYTYDQYDQIVKIEKVPNTQEESIIVSLSRDQYGNIKSVTDAEGNVWVMEYTNFNQLSSLITPEGIQKIFSYDPNNNLSSASTLLEDGSQVQSRMYYDVLDNLTKVDFDLNAGIQGTISFSYDPNENSEAIINPEGTRRKYEYDAFQRPVKKYARITTTNGEKQIISYKYKYDKVGNMVSVTNPLGHENNVGYDKLGRISKVVNQGGMYMDTVYDEKGNLIEYHIYSSDGKVLQKSTYEYDSRGQVLAEYRHDVQDQSRVLDKIFIYDDYGRIQRVLNHKGATISYVYDGFGRVESIEDTLGKNTIFLYNKNNQVIAKVFITTEGEKFSILYDYDKDGRLIKSQNHIGYTQFFAYNNLNQLVSFTDAEGIKTNYTYDYRGNLLSIQKSDGRVNIVTEHRYDKNGNLISLTDGEGNTSTFVYDDLDRQIQRILPDGSTTTYRYDENSNLVKRTDPNGNIVVNSYDVMDRLVTRDITLGTNIGGVTAEVYRYDPLGRLVYSNDSQQNEQIYVYDGLGGLISETNGGKEVTYNFDEVHDLSQIIYPSGRKFGRSYDILGRLTEVQDQWNWSNVASYSYDSASLLNTSYGNFTETNYSYDQLLRLKTMSHDKFTTPSPMNSIDYRYTYDKVNNIVKNGLDTYRYDDIYRLNTVRYNDGDLVKRQNGELEKGSHESTDYNQRLQNRNYDKVGNRRTEYNDVPFVPIKDDIHIYSNCHPGGNGGHTNHIEQQFDGEFYQESCPLTEQDAIVGGTKGGKGKASTQPNDAYEQYQESGTTTSSEEIILQDIDTEMSRRDAITARPSSTSDTDIVLESSTLVAAKGGGGGSKGNKGGTNTKNNGNTNYKGNGADRGFKKGRNKTKKTEAKATRCARKAATDKDADGGRTKKCAGIDLEEEDDEASEESIYPELFTGEEPEVPQDFVVYHPNELNQYMSVTYGNLSGIKFDYDANGNLVQNEKFRFQYDYKNRLIKAWTYSTVGAGPFVYTAEDPEGQAAAAQEYLIVEFTYDTMGRRVTKRVDRKSNVGRFIKYVYAGQDAIEEEWFYNIGEGREQLKEYVYGQGIDDVLKVYITRSDSERQQRFYKDHQGSVVAIADDKGKIVESYRYDAFGNLILGFQKNDIKFNLDPSNKNAQKNVADSKMWITNSRLYTAREWDEELELYYYRGRHYDARMGRFMQRDPIGYADDVNLYAYVANNPVNYLDPWGLESKPILILNQHSEKYNRVIHPGTEEYDLLLKIWEYHGWVYSHAGNNVVIENANISACSPTERKDCLPDVPSRFEELKVATDTTMRSDVVDVNDVLVACGPQDDNNPHTCQGEYCGVMDPCIGSIMEIGVEILDIVFGPKGAGEVDNLIPKSAVDDIMEEGVEIFGKKSNDIIEEGIEIVGKGSDEMIEEGIEIISKGTDDVIEEGVEIIGKGSDEIISLSKIDGLDETITNSQKVVREFLEDKGMNLSDETIDMIKTQKDAEKVMRRMNRGEAEFRIWGELRKLRDKRDLLANIAGKNADEVDVLVKLLIDGRSEDKIFEEIMTLRIRKELYSDIISNPIGFEGIFKETRYPDATSSTTEGGTRYLDFKLGYEDSSIEKDQLIDYLAKAGPNDEVNYVFSSLKGLENNKSRIESVLKLSDDYVDNFKVFYLDEAGELVEYARLLK